MCDQDIALFVNIVQFYNQEFKQKFLFYVQRMYNQTWKQWKMPEVLYERKDEKVCCNEEKLS
jgi:hypothetical protein